MFRTLFVALQYSLPHHALSRLVGRIAASERRWLAQPLIRAFMARFRVDMSEAQHPDPAHYASFNEFFTRPLRPDARPLAAASQLPAAQLICPVDGAVSQAGPIQQDTLVQAKGHVYSVNALLGRNSNQPSAYQAGRFATIYLSPRDYHRIHMPFTGTLRRMTFVPGRLFSVNPTTTERVPGLFARNERVVCEFETAAGPATVVLVGAMIVASIATSWAGTIAPRKGGLQQWDYEIDAPTLQRGDELGRFLLGSTIVILTSDAGTDWTDSLRPGQAVRVGAPLGG
ncbi:phosphatidylserine decarboxylase [Natronospirillum operosum]|uniref:Phosphatidylserine decarboxylase proenzyme n=1 Tax=Natronospirillum operosum TaxID=2759953 RepID=A0A4Z0W903_9GAMM|nr:archaetidylserine decarboxylase [Natronospirillum operosum]TGG94057.1 phosphatidylserine decarboxylase [Natronospirillum operosum]